LSKLRNTDHGKSNKEILENNPLGLTGVLKRGFHHPMTLWQQQPSSLPAEVSPPQSCNSRKPEHNLRPKLNPGQDQTNPSPISSPISDKTSHYSKILDKSVVYARYIQRLGHKW